MSEETAPKTITGYCEPWSARGGDSVTLRASRLGGASAQLDLVRISCGDPTSAGPGFLEHDVASDLPPDIELSEQPLRPGSFGEIALAGIGAATRLGVSLAVMATRPAEPQTVLALDTGHATIALTMRDGIPMLTTGDATVPLRDQPLAVSRWYEISLEVDLATQRMTAEISTAPSRSPGRDLREPGLTETEAPFPLPAIDLRSIVLGGGVTDGSPHGDFDGRIARPRILCDDIVLEWDLSKNMHSRSIAGVGDHSPDGLLHQLPTRAVTGPTWDSTHQSWADDPSQWDAIHFHKGDLYDAGWVETATVNLPHDLPSGIYAFRIRAGDEVDRVPFFVRPAVGQPTADVAMIMPTATYMAYANHRMLFEGADFIGKRARLRPEHDYVRSHPEIGRSMYEKHLDGSGVMFSSRLRPVLNLRPGADGWNFTPDTDINAWLEQTEVGHDIVTDDDIHLEGYEAIADYRVLVTGSHPEYWSTAMLDALEAWQRRGGRLMYLGGNGFYWRVAFSDEWPGAMELRRAEDGVRNWQPGNGENFHAFGGEYGGMWRRNDRPPNELVGIGFAAQGFGRATYFEPNTESMTSRASWIWDGVELDEGRLGTSGLGGGAAGQEIDRYDTRLGSPEHAVVLASATDFGPDMLRTKEEFEASVDVATPDPYVRADIVFYETPGGGAVFSVGSISWFGALARNGYDNDVAQMSTNVLRRFADPTPFVGPHLPPAAATRVDTSGA